MSVWRPDPVFDLSPMGLGAYEGLAAIRVAVRITNHGDTDEARAAPERLAESTA
jgi:hypothetical protein